MMECVGISCFDPAGEPEDEFIAVAPEGTKPLLDDEKNWRTAAPTREALRGACALCHLVY